MPTYSTPMQTSDNDVHQTVVRLAATSDIGANINAGCDRELEEAATLTYDSLHNVFFRLSRENKRTFTLQSLFCPPLADNMCTDQVMDEQDASHVDPPKNNSAFCKSKHKTRNVPPELCVVRVRSLSLRHQAALG